MTSSNTQISYPDCQSKLRDLLAKMFPSQDDFEIIVENRSTETFCKIYIGGELFSCSGTYESEYIAKETISTLAIEFLEELSSRKQDLYSKYSGSHIGKVLNQIFEGVSSLSNKGHEEIEQNTTKSSLTLRKETIIKDFDVESITKDTGKEPTDSVNYSLLLNRYIQKTPHIFPKFNPQYYTQAKRFGCSVEFSSKHFETPAVFKTKQEAREEIAKLVIESFFPYLLQVSHSDLQLHQTNDTLTVNYITWLHEFCQKESLEAPNYKKIQMDQNWLVEVSFEKCLFKSKQHQNCTSAKMDVAKQIYDYLKTKESRKSMNNPNANNYLSSTASKLGNSSSFGQRFSHFPNYSSNYCNSYNQSSFYVVPQGSHHQLNHLPQYSGKSSLNPLFDSTQVNKSLITPPAPIYNNPMQQYLLSLKAQALYQQINKKSPP
jgi:hypothetical protein